MLALKPYWGKPAIRDFRGDDGNVGIIRSPIRAIVLLDRSKTVYIANAGSNSVSAVDIASRKEVARIPVGQVPKRNITSVLP